MAGKIQSAVAECFEHKIGEVSEDVLSQCKKIMSAVE